MCHFSHSERRAKTIAHVWGLAGASGVCGLRGSAGHPRGPARAVGLAAGARSCWPSYWPAARAVRRARASQPAPAPQPATPRGAPCRTWPRTPRGPSAPLGDVAHLEPGRAAAASGHDRTVIAPTYNPAAAHAGTDHSPASAGRGVHRKRRSPGGRGGRGVRALQTFKFRNYKCGNWVERWYAGSG
jgi:hypothetical protein